MDKPENSKIISTKQSDGCVEKEGNWLGQVTGFDSFPNCTVNGHGISKIFDDISISNWESLRP